MSDKTGFPYECSGCMGAAFGDCPECRKNKAENEEQTINSIFNPNDRLTTHTPNGACLIINAEKEFDARIELMEKFKRACNKLALFEDLIEKGEIIRLPIHIGNSTIEKDEHGDLCIKTKREDKA